MGFLLLLRTKPATDSNVRPAAYSDLRPAGVPTWCRLPGAWFRRS